MCDFGVSFVTTGDTRLRAAGVSELADWEHVRVDMFCDAVGRIVIRRCNDDRFFAENGSCQNARSWVALLIESWSRPRRSLRQGILL